MFTKNASLTLEKINLFTLDSPKIKISMDIYFNEKHQLIFEGYDVGKTVEDLIGDLDYEYFYIIEWDEVKKLMSLLNINSKDKLTILKGIKERFQGNDAYSKFGNFMRAHQIIFQQMIWR